jgi:RNA polymerase sigma-70 factor (ECF subfamily)
VSIPDEKDLIKACVAGDAKAQKQVYDKYARTMFGICIRYSNSYEEAKDILQDGFIKVYTKMGQFSFNGSFEGWMKRIFINTALEFYRSNKQQYLQTDIAEADQKEHSDFVIEKISQKEILAAMNKMALGYRTVLNMYIVEGYSHAEIASALGISEGTSKSQLSRARIILQQELLKLQRTI